MHSDLIQLVELQDILTGLKEKGRLRNQLPEALQLTEERYQEERVAIESRRTEAEEAVKERRRWELELAGEEEKLAKYQNQLMTVKNQKEYGAMLNEIDSTKKRLRLAEEEIIVKMERSETLARELGEHQTAFAAVEAERNAARSSWDHETRDLVAEITVLQKRRQELEKEIPAALLATFLRVYKGKRDLAVARIAGYSCSACQMRLRPALVQEVRAGTSMLTCENCSRFLYFREGENA